MLDLVLRRGRSRSSEAPNTPLGAYQFFDLRRGSVTCENEQFGFERLGSGKGMKFFGRRVDAEWVALDSDQMPAITV